MDLVIIPTDFSDASWNATQHGLHYAKMLGYKALIIYAIDKPHGSAANMISIDDMLKEDAKRELRKVQKKVEVLSEFKDVTIQYDSAEGSLIDVLRENIDPKGRDVVCMGSRGVSNIQEQLFGSNATAVVKKIDAPIFLVPPKAEFSLENGLTCGIDVNTTLHEKDNELLQKIVAVTPGQDLQLIHVHVKNKKIEAISKPVQLSWVKSDIHKIVGNEVVEALATHMVNSQSDGLVLIKKHRNFWEQLFQESVSKSLASLAFKPLIILRS